MRTIWKFPFEITDRVVIPMPVGAVILRVECQRNRPVLWALVDSGVSHELRQFRIVGTGHDANEIKADAHIGTFQQEDAFVWHMFSDDADGNQGAGCEASGRHRGSEAQKIP